MKRHRLKTFTGGWFIGKFNPSLVDTDTFEVAVKNYSRGYIDESHYHKLAKEYTVIVYGIAEMNDIMFVEGDIIEVEKNEKVQFKALTDVTTVVVKIPSVPGDKYTE